MRLDQLGLIGVVLAATLVLLVPAGFATLQAGLVRPKNAASAAVATLANTIIAATLFWICGFAFMYGASAGGVVGTTGFFLYFGGSTAADTLAFFLLQVVFCATAVTIVTGALAERMSFRATVLSTALFACLVYPLAGHWVWGNGFLKRAGFFDAAGATVVHVLGGAIALGALLAVGNRQGRYTRRGKVVPFAGASVAWSALGFFLVWLGFLGWTAGATAAGGSWMQMPVAVLDTVLAGAAGGLVALVAAWVQRGVPDIELVMRGSLAGLIAVTAGCFVFPPMAALVVGGVAALVLLGLDALLARLRVDDAVGAVPVHLGAGAWGTVAVGFYAGDLAGRGQLAQLAVQLEGVAIVVGWGFAVSFAAFKIGSLFARLRVSGEEEYIGLSVTEHQAGTELMDLMDVLEEASRHETPEAALIAEPFAEVAHVGVNDAGFITYTNPAASAIFGYAEVEFPRVPATALFAKGELPGGLDGARRELQGLRRTGEDFPMEVWRGVAVAPGAEIELSVLCIKDITWRKEKEEGLNRPTAQIRSRFEREIEETPVVRIVPEPHAYVLGSEVAAAGVPGEWFGYFRDEPSKSLTFYSGEILWQPASAVSLLTGVIDGTWVGADDTHGLYLGNASHPPERQLRNLAEVVNRIALTTGRGEARMMMALLHVDLKTGEARFLGAGVATPMFWKSGRAVKELGGGGTPFGKSYEPEFDLRSLKLSAGDVIVSVTSGMVETYTPEGKLFRASELKKIIAGHRDLRDIRDEIMARTRAVWKDRAQEHAVMVFQWNGA